MEKFTPFINEKKEIWQTSVQHYAKHIREHVMGMIIPLPGNICSCNKWRIWEKTCYCGKVPVYTDIYKNNAGECMIHIEKE